MRDYLDSNHEPTDAAAYKIILNSIILYIKKSQPTLRLNTSVYKAQLSSTLFILNNQIPALYQNVIKFYIYILDTITLIPIKHNIFHAS